MAVRGFQGFRERFRDHQDQFILSLSAILLDQEYYDFLLSHRSDIDGCPVADVHALLLFKARAWIDLSARKDSGDFVCSTDISKHRTDVCRMCGEQKKLIEAHIILRSLYPFDEDNEPLVTIYDHDHTGMSSNHPGLGTCLLPLEGLYHDLLQRLIPNLFYAAAQRANRMAVTFTGQDWTPESFSPGNSSMERFMQRALGRDQE